MIILLPQSFPDMLGNVLLGVECWAQLPGWQRGSLRGYGKTACIRLLSLSGLTIHKRIHVQLIESIDVRGRVGRHMICLFDISVRPQTSKQLGGVRKHRNGEKFLDLDCSNLSCFMKTHWSSCVRPPEECKVWGTVGDQPAMMYAFYGPEKSVKGGSTFPGTPAHTRMCFYEVERWFLRDELVLHRFALWDCSWKCRGSLTCWLRMNT